MNLPEPSAEARAHSQRLTQHIRDAILAAGGWISFSRYMELALYAPGLGYYTAGARKLGASGDFVTAPELSPLFGQTLARQLAQAETLGFDTVLELGAGTGALAAALLEELESLGSLPRQYLILELSPDLRERERDLLTRRVPHLVERVAWINQLPRHLEGVVIANEVLDAMPTHIVRNNGGIIEEAGVCNKDDYGAGEFAMAFRQAEGELYRQAAALELAPGTTTEIQLVAQAFMSSLAASLTHGLALFIDYGFASREYYHPQRSSGTLMCHYRHHAHDDPFFLPGMQDVTTHVDFSAIAHAAGEGGLDLAGYVTQAQFLINCGITEVLSAISPEDTLRYLPLANAANRLLSPAEMGELFKVIAFSKGLSIPFLGFSGGDRSGTL
jgi:SAM-dependent MidA family methyltransferase